jgi:hypothetical protein
MKNLLLSQLSDDDFSRLEPCFKITPFKQHTLLFEAERVIEHVYFPTTAIVSLVVALETGEIVEAAMVGSDGVVGASAALDGRISLSRGVIQLAGDIAVCSIEGLKSAALESPKLLSLLIRHEQTVYAQAQQSAACFSAHHVHARLLSLAAAGEGSGGYRHAHIHARIFSGDAGRPAHFCNDRGAHTAGCGLDQVLPRENPDPRRRSSA